MSRLFVPILLFWTVVLACSAARWRQYTYPPDFTWLSSQQIEGTMGALAAQVHALDEIMESEAGPEGNEERVVVILTEMQRLARSLKTGSRSNHPRIDRAAGDLQRDIDRALRDARRTPPSYYFAGEVVGACEYCHVPRHENRRQPASL